MQIQFSQSRRQNSNKADFFHNNNSVVFGDLKLTKNLLVDVTYWQPKISQNMLKDP